MQNLRNSVEVWTYSALWIWLWAHYSITENLDIQGSAIKNNVLPMSEWTEGLWWATAGNGSDTSLGQCHLKLMRPTVASFFFWSSCNSSLSLDHLNYPFKLSSFENSWVLLFFPLYKQDCLCQSVSTVSPWPHLHTVIKNSDGRILFII